MVSTIEYTNVIFIHLDGIPKLHYFGTEGDYHVLVMELLGQTLEELMSYCEHTIALKSVILIAD